MPIITSPQARSVAGLKEVTPVVILSPARKNPKKHTVAAANSIIMSFACGIMCFRISVIIVAGVFGRRILETSGSKNAEFLIEPGGGEEVTKILLARSPRRIDLGVANSSQIGFNSLG